MLAPRPRAIVLPPALDPLRDPHGMQIAAALTADGASVPMPDLTFVFIVFSNRSGSTYLGELLATTGYFNAARELLNADTVLPVSHARGFDSFAAYFAATAAEKARNGHFVVKASIGQLAVLAAHGILERILPHSRFILTERMDKLAQAISWQIAAQSGVFTSHDSTANRPEPVYNRDVLRHDLEGLTQLHATIALFMALNGIVPLHLTYEFLTTRRKQAGRFACEFLGQPQLEIDPAKVQMKRQATRRNAEWRERFLSGA